MKFSLLLVIGAAYAAENFAPPLLANSTCADIYRGMYAKCRANALGIPCSTTDDFCNCRQSQNLAKCISYCFSDPIIYANLPRQEEESYKWCINVPSSLLYPTSTSAPTPTSVLNNTLVNNLLNSASPLQSAKLLAVSAVLAGLLICVV
ncbi:hypothetical protein K7432_001297 [Basidiobolus ranarum]|uniref:Uncharacterized protein n=1 Tax=Basidiobolus ranarum TaxID=34480 RepID=A0ABR2X354_9FUNG